MIVSGQHIKKYHGAQLVLEDVTFEIPRGGRAGLIGRNGCGKTTLLRLIAGLERPDEGELAVRKDTRIGYLSQIQEAGIYPTVYDMLVRSFRNVLQLKDRMTELESEMSDPRLSSDPDALHALLITYAEAQERFEREGGYEMDTRIAQVAAGLRIDSAQFSRAYDSLSGGEKTKAALASLLIERPTLLLLDEPTNHLDLGGIEWLETYLRDYEGTCVIVSHDRYFLDRVVTQIVELEDGESAVYQTSYTGYVQEKEERLLRQYAEFQEQQKNIAKMKEAIKQLETWGRIGGNGKFFRRAASMRKALERMEKVRRPVLERRAADFGVSMGDRSGQDVMAFDGVVKAFGPRTVLDGVSGSLRFGDKTAIVGDNGSGKSTLFKLLLGEIAPDEGKIAIGSRVEIGYLGQEDKPEDYRRSVLDYFREKARLEEGEARARLAKQLFYGPDVFKSVGSLSGGEWTRLRLALLMHRQPNLLLLDEPTNHLDIASREALEESLEEFPGTVLAISHDRYFMNRLARRVWEIRNGALNVYMGSFDEYREKSMAKRASETDRSSLAAGDRPQRKPASAKRSEAGYGKEADLEAAIAEAEAAIAELDAKLAAAEHEAELGLSALTELWSERERRQAALDNLYEEWLGGR